MIRKGLAEFLGTYLLVFCGVGACTINEVTHGTISHVGVAITFGLVVTVLIYAFGNVSGANLNPAVSIAFWLGQKMETFTMIIYVTSQIVGAICASATLYYLFPSAIHYGATIPLGSESQSFVLELLLSFILMFVVTRVGVQESKYQHIAGGIIGMVVLLEAMFAGPISGASMNPARSIGPAIVSGETTSLWLYLVAPVGGAVAGYFLAVFFENSQD